MPGAGVAEAVTWAAALEPRLDAEVDLPEPEDQDQEDQAMDKTKELPLAH